MNNFIRKGKYLLHSYDWYAYILVGFNTMCGHCIISVGRYALDYKLVKPQSPETKVNIQCPCGLVKVFVEYSNGKSGRVRFHSVPAFVYAEDLELQLENYGRIRYDIAFGGVYYAIATASQFELNLKHSPTSSLSAAGVALAQAVRRAVKIEHHEAPDLGYLAGVILVDDNELNPENVSANICITHDGQVSHKLYGIIFIGFGSLNIRSISFYSLVALFANKTTVRFFYYEHSRDHKLYS